MLAKVIRLIGENNKIFSKVKRSVGVKQTRVG